LFDETGTAMLPTYAIKPPGLRYRYYVSKPALKGERSKAAISRIPAPPFEALISYVMVRLGLDKVVQVVQVDHVGQVDRNSNPVRGDSQVVQVLQVVQVDQIRRVLQRIEILPNSVVVRLDRTVVLAAWRAVDSGASDTPEPEIIDRRRELLASGETIRDEDGQLILTLPVRARFRGGQATVLEPRPSAGSTPRPDMALIKAIARANSWRQLLLSGEVNSIEALAKRLGEDRGHVAKTLNLGFLSPALMRTVLRGEQPPSLRLTHLLAADLPVSWRKQEVLVAGSVT
jgi:hypothetical protein